MNAQNITPVSVTYFTRLDVSESIQLEQAPKLESFVETWAGLNKKRRGFYGYRVKISAEVGTQARQHSSRIRLECKGTYPDIPVYVLYNDPNFEVHLGDFRTKFEALSLLKKLENKYPEAFVIYEIVEFPEL